MQLGNVFCSLFCMKCQVLLNSTWKLKDFFTKCTIIWSIFDFLFTCFQMPWNVWLMFNVFRALSTNVLITRYNITLIWLLMKASFHIYAGDVSFSIWKLHYSQRFCTELAVPYLKHNKRKNLKLLEQALSKLLYKSFI